MEPDLSVVVPMYNEQDVLPILAERLRPVLDGLRTSYEVVAVDDGSSDLTPALLHKFARTWPELRVVRLRTNAGHQAAISAGLEAARGDYVVTIDADLQDPPECIATMLQLARDEGVDVVYGIRIDRSVDTRFKRWTARAFYRLIQALSGTSAETNAGDFRLMSRPTVDAVNAMPSHDRVLRFLVPALGFPSSRVEYVRDERAAGQSKYPFLRMLKLSLDSVTGFSTAPLRVATLAGLFAAAAAVFLMLYILIARGYGQTVAGWTSTVLIVAGFAAVQLLSLGILGEYIGRMYRQMQGRPAYFVAYDSLDEPDQRPGQAPTGPSALPTRTHDTLTEHSDDAASG
jgi:glycosyltransferase involved in cell wall biosynthesis